MYHLVAIKILVRLLYDISLLIIMIDHLLCISILYYIYLNQCEPIHYSDNIIIKLAYTLGLLLRLYKEP